METSNAVVAALRDAGTVSGMDALRIVDEPTASATAHALDKKKSGERNILVYDVGGDAFAVSLSAIGEDLRVEGYRWEISRRWLPPSGSRTQERGARTCLEVSVR